MKKGLSALLILIVAIMNVSAAPIVLNGVPSKYQGTWRVIAISQNRGKTVQKGSNRILCVVSASQVDLGKGSQMQEVIGVKQMISDGVVYTGVSFENGKTWVISDAGPNILVQLINDKGEESVRFMCSIE